MNTMKRCLIKRILPGLLGIGFVVAGSSAHAKLVCDDLSDLGNGTVYAVNQAIPITDNYAEVNYLYSVIGEPIINDANFVELSPSNLAGDDSSELHLNNAMISVVLAQPATAVSMQVAQNTGSKNKALLSNFEVNGEKIQTINGLASSNGLVLGTKAKGQVSMSTDLVNPVPQVSAQWIDGYLKLKAESGAIESFSIAGQQIMIDDVCLWY